MRYSSTQSQRKFVQPIAQLPLSIHRGKIINHASIQIIPEAARSLVNLFDLNKAVLTMLFSLLINFSFLLAVAMQNLSNFVKSEPKQFGFHFNTFVHIQISTLQSGSK